jgi:hypothetical protein
MKRTGMLLVILLAAWTGMAGSTNATTASNGLLVKNNTDQNVVAILSGGVEQRTKIGPKESWKAIGWSKGPATVTFNAADGKRLASKSYSNAASATLMLTTEGYRIEIQSATAAHASARADGDQPFKVTGYRPR